MQTFLQSLFILFYLRTFILVSQMIVLKKMLDIVKGSVQPQIIQEPLQLNVYMQLLMASAIKDFIFTSFNQHSRFIIPKELKERVKDNRIVLVLDLDGTLVCSGKFPNKKYQFSAKHERGDILFNKRPYLDQFLKACSEIFDIYIYTASQKSYADAILSVVDHQNILQKRFYRESCRCQSGVYFKDLNYLKTLSGCNKKMILLDDLDISIRFNSPNSVLIEQFEGNPKDMELANIFPELLNFYQAK